MERKDKGRRQSTLLGLWDRKRGVGQVEAPSAGKRNRDPSSQPRSPPNSVAPSLRINHTITNKPHWEDISLPNATMMLLRNCVGGKKLSERRSTIEALVSLPDWNDNVTFKIYGKECRMRRRVCQFSTGGELSYSYSGLKNVVAPEFPQILYEIKRQVEDLLCDRILDIAKDGALSTNNLSEFAEMIKSTTTNSKDRKEIYNYCLCNHYRDGEECMGYHADDETSLNPHTPIASISLGISRSFDVRPRKKNSDGKRCRVVRIALGDGDLLLMLPPMQSHYEHAIPVEKRVAGERINLTFRRITTGDNK